MIRIINHLIILSLIIGICLTVNTTCPAQGGRPEDAQFGATVDSTTVPGDRVLWDWDQAIGEAVLNLSEDTYRLGPSDILNINVRGRSVLNYKIVSDSGGTDTSRIIVGPTGIIYLPLVGEVTVIGKTIAEIEPEIRDKLAKYFKNFTLDISLAKPRILYAWAYGEIRRPGLQALSATATASLCALKSGIKPNGSMRCVELIRDDEKYDIDLYRMLVLGDVESDIRMRSGDMIRVPPITKFVDVKGEVFRAGRFEMVTVNGREDEFRIKDLLELTIGHTPFAMLSKATILRVGQDGKKIMLKADLGGEGYSPGGNILMQSGDMLTIPSIYDYQPIIRLVGEFKGEGVTQRTAGGTSADYENKTGIYYLKAGQTAGEVIRSTGGYTPQADLKRAHVRRTTDGNIQRIDLDLERILLNGDASADVTLQNGDFIVIPSLSDRVYIFGEIVNPGALPYSPSRKLLDYIGDAGGPTIRSKMETIRIHRGDPQNPETTRVNLSKALKGRKNADNPVLMAGDVVYVPSKFIGNARDGLQLVFTALSLWNLLAR